LVYTAFYQQIELELRKTNNPWPKTIGIDEHSFIRNVKGAGREFVTVFIDYTNKRMKDVVMGKSLQALKSSSIADIKERENVKNVVLDLSPTFRSFAQEFFPNAKLIADKFHVVKLMHPLIHELRGEVVKDYLLNQKRTNPVIRLLLRYRKKLRYYQRSAKWRERRDSNSRPSA
jgi:transposase